MSLEKDTLLKDTLAEIREGEFVESYIEKLTASSLSDGEFTLIAGNIRGFFAWMKKQGMVKDAL